MLKYTYYVAHYFSMWVVFRCHFALTEIDDTFFCHFFVFYFFFFFNGDLQTEGKDIKPIALVSVNVCLESPTVAAS